MDLPVFLIKRSIRLTIACHLIFICSIHAQDQQRDSLRKVLAGNSNAVERVSVLNALAKSYWNINNDSAIYFADSARRLAGKIGDIAGEAEGNRIIGVTIWYQLGNPEEMKAFLEKALALYKPTHKMKGIADTYNNLGSFWKYENDYEKSLMYYDSSLAIYRTLGDKKGEAAVLNYIGIVYQDKGEFSKAIDRTLQGLVIRKTTNDHLGIVFSYLNVGNIFLAGGQTEQAIKYYQDGLDYAIRHGVNPPAMTFNSLGNAYLQVGDFKKAGEYLLKGGKEHVNKSPDELLIARLFYKLGEPDSALLYFKKVYENPGTNINTDRKAQALAGLSRIMMEKGDNKQAIELAKKSYEIPGSVNKLTIAESAGILGELYEQNGEQAKALTFYKVQHGILDSIANRNYQNKLAYFETNSEMEKVNSQLQALSVQKALQEKLYRQEKLLKNFLIAISILIVMASFFVIRNMYSRRKKILAQNELLDLQNKQVKQAFDELKSAQKQLIQSEKMASLGELTAGIAHEIQNPLNFVKNFSELNQELLVDITNEIDNGNLNELKIIAGNIRENEAKILFHGNRADAIVKNMLQHSQTSNNVKEQTDINMLAGEYLRLAYHGFMAKNKSLQITCNTEFDNSAPKINLIPQDIGRVLLNLFNNAFQAVTEKKKEQTNSYEPIITLSTMKAGNNVFISVKDNGKGIPLKVLDKIFQPFFTTKPAGQGTGLGLSLSYDIIKAHGGEIKVETKEGEGSEFTVHLPVIN